MSFNPIVNGKPVTALMNSNVEIALRAIGQNAIQQLQDRIIYPPADGGRFVEAHTSSGGRLGTVISGSTTATFDTDKYKYAGVSNDEIVYDIPLGMFNTTQSNSIFIPWFKEFDPGSSARYKLISRANFYATGTLHDPDTTSGAVNLFNQTLTPTASLGVGTYNVGRTFSANTVEELRCTVSFLSGGSSSIQFQTYDGATWTNEGTVTNITGVGEVFKSVTVGSSIQGARVKLTLSGSGITAFIKSFSILGAEVDNTGFLDSDIMNTYTAFTEPVSDLIVELVPTVSSPSTNYPSLTGVALTAGRPD